MWNLRKVGIILIIVGTFIPSVLYPFAKPTTSASIMQIALGSKGITYEPRLNDLEIVFKKGKWHKDGKNTGHFEGRIAVPYHYTIAAGITAAFLGIALMALTGKKKREAD